MSTTPRLVFGQPQPGARWYKGNTHTHTLNSDGDSTPDDVVRWYREHGYDFLVLTDHNYLTDVSGLNAVHGAAERFLVIKGEEVTDRLGQTPLHINGLDVGRTVEPQGGASRVEIAQRNVDAIRAAQGIPHINHPNFGWALSADDLAQVHRYRLLEIFNGHPMVNNLGGGGTPGLEEVWDGLLSNGQRVFGIAVDDAHHFKRPGDPTASGPGRGWVVVRAPRLETRALLEALEAGAFYASTGVVLEDCSVIDRTLTVRIAETSYSRYRVQFIGRQGRLLKEATASPATFTIRGDEQYVRVRVLESNGAQAWLQPVFVE